MSTVFALAQNARLVDERGGFTPEFKRFLDDLLARTGGISGGIYSQLTYSGTVTWNLEKDPIAVLVLSGPTTVTAANYVAGNLYPYRLTIVQDAVGRRTVTWGSMFKFPGGVPPTLTAAGNAVDELWFSSDGTNMKTITGSLDIR